MLETWNYSQPSVSPGFASTNLTKWESEVFAEKKIPVSSKKQNLLHTHNYLHKIYIVTICIAFILAIIINLELILSIQQDLYGLYADTAPFYLRDLSIGRFWYLWEGWYRSSAVHDAEITCAVTKIHDFNGRRRHRIKPRFH